MCFVGIIHRVRIVDVHRHTAFSKAHWIVHHVSSALELNVPSRVLIDVDAIGTHFTMVGNLVSATVFVVDDEVHKLVSRAERQAHSLSDVISQRIAKQRIIVHVGKERPVSLGITFSEEVVLVCRAVERILLAGKF